MSLYIGIDNGVSGSIAVLRETELFDYTPTPTKKCLNYTKKAAYFTRVDVKILRGWVTGQVVPLSYQMPVQVFMERPMVNPGRFVATASALRAYEATLIALESVGLPVTRYLDSREWQKKLLPSGLKGPAELKEASRQVGIRMFPRWQKQIIKQGDADAILIAYYGAITYGGANSAEGTTNATLPPVEGRG